MRAAFLTGPDRYASDLTTPSYHQNTLEAVAELALAQLADYCVVDVRQATGPVVRVAVAQRKAAPAALQEWLHADPEASSLIQQVINSGQAAYGNRAEAVAAGSELWTRGVTCFMSLPLLSFGRICGVVTFLSLNGRTYAQPELAVAADLVRRAAVAVEHARLYEDAVRARLAAESARDALQQSERRYRSLFEESRDAIYITAADGRFIEANRAFLELFGYTREDLRHMNAQALYADANEQARLQREIESKRSLRNFEVKLRTRDAAVLDCLLSSAAHLADDGSVVWYQGIIRDITARKRAEAALARSEHFTRAIISSVREGVIVYDRELRYQVWNAFMEELTGLRAEQVLGRSALESFPHLLEHGIRDLLQRALKGEALRSSDTPYRVPETGRSGWVTGLYSPHVSPDGEVMGVVAVIHDVTERKRAEEQLQHNAFHDSLTGLPNRALFLDRLERLIRHAQRQGNYKFAVLFLDLDRFKIVNDSLGHVVGDELLLAIGHRLEACLRQGDTVARLGGDEFAILLDDVVDVSDATRVAERIERELATAFLLRGYEVYTSASIGIALSAANYERPEEVLRDADTAMYRAKSGGRARYQIFDKSMHSQAVEQLQTETDLRRALERQEFLLHFQPVVSLANGELSGFEALVRWQHRHQGLMLPDEFIPLAEETGLIVPIGYWVMRAACAQMRDWLDRFPLPGDFRVSVNLSSRQFAQPDLVDQIDKILQQTGCPGRNLQLEITETTVMQNAAQAAEMLRQLRSRGIGLCIDDFGTGYSSLSYLKRFPIDTLKIDRSFIKQIDEDSSSVELIETMVALSRILGLGAVAEGVETAEQLELVRRLGSHFAQGFYFSTPVDAEAAGQLLWHGLDTGVR